MALAVAGGGDVVRKPVTTKTTRATVTSAVPIRRRPETDRPEAGTCRKRFTAPRAVSTRRARLGQHQPPVGGVDQWPPPVDLVDGPQHARHQEPTATTATAENFLTADSAAGSAAGSAAVEAGPRRVGRRPAAEAAGSGPSGPPPGLAWGGFFLLVLVGRVVVGRGSAIWFAAGSRRRGGCREVRVRPAAEAGQERGQSADPHGHGHHVDNLQADGRATPARRRPWPDSTWATIVPSVPAATSASPGRHDRRPPRRATAPARTPARPAATGPTPPAGTGGRRRWRRPVVLRWASPRATTPAVAATNPASSSPTRPWRRPEQQGADPRRPQQTRQPAIEEGPSTDGGHRPVAGLRHAPRRGRPRSPASVRRRRTIPR